VKPPESRTSVAEVPVVSYSVAADIASVRPVLWSARASSSEVIVTEGNDAAVDDEVVIAELIQNFDSAIL